MKKIILFLIVVGIFVVPANATSLSGTITYPNSAGLTGRIFFALSQQGAQLSTGGCGGPAVIVPTAQVIFSVTAGTIQGGAVVVGNDCIAPANTYYIVQVRDAQNNLLFSQNWKVTGASENIGTILPVIVPLGTASIGTAFITNLVITGTCTFNGAICTSGAPSAGVTLKTNGVNNGEQTVLDLAAGAGITIVDSGSGPVTISGTAGTFYQTVESNGSAQTQQPILNLISGTNITASCVNNGGATRTDCTISSSAGGSVTSVATTSPITGGTITTTGTIGCATCVTSAASLTSNAVVIGGGGQASSTISADTTTTHALFATAGAPAFRALATTDMPATTAIRDFGTTYGDTGGSALTSGSVVYFTVPYACTIAAWNISVDAGTATIDIWKIATGTAVPTVSNTITASALPAISSGTSIHSTTLTGWTTSVAANDIFGFQLKTVATAKFVEIDVQCNQ